MSHLVTITPKPGTRKFRTVSNMQQFNRITGSSDPSQVQATGEFKGQRFPNSRQIFKPIWSFTKRRWMLAGCEQNSLKLNAIAKAAKLKYEKGDPRYPGYIENADITDFDDPFFKHTKLKVIAREGEFVLDKDVAKDKILIMAIQANHQFALKGMTGTNTSNRVKYLISDKNIDQEAKKYARNQKTEAITFYTQLSDREKIKIAMGMGLIVRDNAKPDIVDDLLWEAANNDRGRAANGLTPQGYFIAMCQAEPAEIDVRFLIQKARGDGHLKKTKDGYMLFGQPVGLSDIQVYAYFKNPENQKLLMRLETALEQDPVPAPEKKGLIDLSDQPKAEVIEQKIEEVKEPEVPNMDQIMASTGTANLDDVPGTLTDTGPEDTTLDNGAGDDDLKDE